MGVCVCVSVCACVCMWGWVESQVADSLGKAPPLRVWREGGSEGRMEGGRECE